MSEILAKRLPLWHTLLPGWIAYPPLIAIVVVTLQLVVGGRRATLWHVVVPLGVLIAGMIAAAVTSLRRRS